jgi:pimeloyl-ACP methyl ester carboxylesterase
MAARSECYPFKSDAARDAYLHHYDAWSEAWPVPCETRSFETEFGVTFARVSGPPDAPALVLLPGGRAPSLCWIPLVAALARHHHVVAIDAIYDVGRSVDARPLLKPVDVADWLDGVLDALALESGVNLMGLSMGAWAVAEYSLANPHRVAKTVWLSPAGVVAPISAGFIAHGVLSAVTGTWGLRTFLEWIMPDAARADGAPGAFYDQMLEDFLASSASFAPRPFPGGPRAFTDEELARLEVPVLYIVGDRERVCPDRARAVSRANALVPHIETEVMAGGGHDVSILKPAETTDRINEFLRG